MPGLRARLIAGRYSSLLRPALWAGIFLSILGIALGLIRWELGNHIARDQKLELERLGALQTAAEFALKTLGRTNDSPCSAPFMDRMRRVAFLPDGLNAFFFAPEGKVSCAADGTHFDPPVDLGAADIPTSATSAPSWRMERDLTPLRHPGAVVVIAQLGDFAVAIPPYTGLDESSRWNRKEIVARGAQGATWTVGGEKGLHAQVSAAGSSYFAIATATSTMCLSQSIFCVTSSADLLGWGREWKELIAFGLVVLALVAWALAGDAASRIARYWSFAERFRRGMNAQSIELVYQPIIDMNTDKVVCIEVLARWRDFDNSIVYPDRFLPLIEQNKQTREFTRIVIDRAYSELDRLPSDGSPLLVNFNIFACDFDSGLILPWLSKFRSDNRFRAGVELIEEHEVEVLKAQQAIETLSQAGVPTFIDDFGTGYSNIERVARLPVEGVKLDRSFAMSQPDSVMGRMLVQVIEMIKASGRLIVVEGVETMDRLNLLRSTGLVDLVQGYVVSQPLQIDELRAFLAHGSKAWADRQAAA